MLTNVINCRTTATTSPSVQDPRLLNSVPAMEVYRFAHFYNIDGLASTALNKIASGFTPSNIVDKLLGDEAAMYPEVKKVMMEYAKAWWIQVHESKEFQATLKGIVELNPHGKSMLSPRPRERCLRLPFGS